jgi:hypothetical protein
VNVLGTEGVVKIEIGIFAVLDVGLLKDGCESVDGQSLVGCLASNVDDEGVGRVRTIFSL